MRRQSSCLVMAANQNSGIDVVFGAEFNFWVQIPNFRRAHHYKISKDLFSGSQHQKSLFTRACLRLLSVSVKQTILCLFTCVCEMLEMCLRLAGGFPTCALKFSDARLQNKQQKNIDLPPQVKIKIDLPPRA